MKTLSINQQVTAVISETRGCVTDAYFTEKSALESVIMDNKNGYNSPRNIITDSVRNICNSYKISFRELYNLISN